MTANSLIESTLKKIAETYPSGTLHQMKQNRPNEWKRLIALEEEINRAALSEDEIILRDALSEYRGFFEEMPRAKEATASARI